MFCFFLKKERIKDRKDTKYFKDSFSVQLFENEIAFVKDLVCMPNVRRNEESFYGFVRLRQQNLLLLFIAYYMYIFPLF